MNRQKDPAQLIPGEFALMTNGRLRNGGPQPITLPTNISNSLPPNTNIQGIYGFDNFLLVFADGLCYVRNYDVDPINFISQPGFQMSATAPTIYACAVPAATVNYNRVPATTLDNIPIVIPSGGVQLIAAINGSPSCIVCQDGSSQPFLILPDGTARQAQTFTQWSSAAGGVREYVPIGTLMVYVNDKLYVLIKDTSDTPRNTMIASSVSGRPLDFVVAIDVNGNKTGTELSGGAIATAYSVDYSELTCMSVVGGGAASPTGEGTSFYVATQKASYLVLPNYTATIYGEPTYSNQVLFTTGPKNNFSVCDILGDAAVIDDSGVKSFNSILTTKFEGRNAPFSAKMNTFFGNAEDDDNNSVIQDITAAYSWSDYGFFAVNTIYGYGVLVYDQLTGFQSFVSFDQLLGDPSVAIKQFADIKTTTGIRELFFITTNNLLYQYFGGSTAICGFYVGDFTASGNGVELKPKMLNPVFVKVVESGIINVDVYVDGQKTETLSKEIDADSSALSTIPYPQSLPFGNNKADIVRPPGFNLTSSLAGNKIGFWLTWNFKSVLLLANASGESDSAIQGFKQQARDYSQFTKGTGGAV